LDVLNYNHLFYFHVAASEGSLAKAADRLGVTQPTVSEQIRQLERKLGVTLFARSTAGLRLTEPGRQAYLHTTPMFRESERLLAVLNQAPVDETRVLRVGVTTTATHAISSTFLLPLFDLPDCIPIVRTSDFSDLLRDLHAHKLDILLCDTEPPCDVANGFRVVELHRPRLVAVAAPGVIVRDDWAGTPVMQYSNGSPYRWEIESFLTGHALKPRIAGEADDPALMLEAAIRGGFIAFVPSTVARDAIAADRVRALAALEPATGVIHALHHDGAVVTEAIGRLVEHARALEA